jgi:hypothetical protein
MVKKGREEVNMKSSNFRIGAIFALLVAWTVPSYAQGNEIYGCYQKNEGELRIVSKPGACRPSETPIFWNKVGPQGPQGVAGQAGPQGPAGPPGAVKVEQGPRVYDAKGQFLGILPNDLEGYLSVFIPRLSKYVSFSSNTGEIDPFFPVVYLYFEGETCTGKAYVDTNLRYQVFRVNGQYGTPRDVPSECRDIRSISSPDWGGGRQCRTRNSTCIPVLPYDELQLPFSVPVVLPFSFEY